MRGIKMTRRQARVADLIKAEIANLLIKEIRDPHLGFTSVTRVRMSPDLRYANVYVSVYGNEEERTESMEALRRARGYIRRLVNRQLRLRYSPEIRFFYDDTLEYAEHIERLMRKIHEERDT